MGSGNSELASLLCQLIEQKTQIEHLIGRVEKVLKRGNAPAPSGGESKLQQPARRGPESALDRMKAVMESTADLRGSNGNLSATRVAKLFGISVSQLANWLGRSKQTISKTPDAESLQEELGYFERVARLRMITKGDADFRKWLRAPHELLDDAPPLELLAKGEWQNLADYVEGILTGSPG